MEGKKVKDFRKNLLLIVVGLLLLAGVNFLDIWTGPEVSSSFFYLIPVIFFAIFFGSSLGILGSILCSAIWFLTDFYSGRYYSHPVIAYWNAFAEMVIFMTVALIIVRLAEERRREKEDKEALLKINEEVMRLSKIKSDFCAMVSHEIRTPMATIRESIKLIDDGIVGEVSPEQKTYLDITKKNVDRLIRLINEILDFSKLEQGKKHLKFVKENLNQIILESVQFHKPLALEKGIQLISDLDPALPEVLVDVDAMNQVLGNVIGNAIKFTRAGSVTVASSSREGEVEVTVTDTGCGIEQSHLSRLFQYFEQIIPEYGVKPEGTGLGLAISRRLVELHNGKIWVESELGKGTVIHFTIPLVDPFYSI